MTQLSRQHPQLSIGKIVRPLDAVFRAERKTLDADDNFALGDEDAIPEFAIPKASDAIAGIFPNDMSHEMSWHTNYFGHLRRLIHSHRTVPNHNYDLLPFALWSPSGQTCNQNVSFSRCEFSRCSTSEHGAPHYEVRA